MSARRAKATITPEEQQAVDKRVKDVMAALKLVVLTEVAKHNGFASWAELAAAKGLIDEEGPNAN